MSNQIKNLTVSNESSKIQFIHESPMILDSLDEKIKSQSSNFAATSEDEASSENEIAKKKLKPGKKTRGRVKIKMEFIRDKVRRFTTFSKRKTGLMKKAYELAQLTGAQLMLLVASETGHVYTFATDKLKPIIDRAEGQDLIETCLNNDAPSKQTSSENSKSFKKTTLGRPQNSTLVNKNIMNMVVNEVKTTEVNKILVPIDLSQHLHYHLQPPTHHLTTNEYSKTTNKQQIKAPKHKIKNIQFDKKNNSVKVRSVNVINEEVKNDKVVDNTNVSDLMQNLKQDDENLNESTKKVFQSFLNTSHTSLNSVLSSQKDSQAFSINNQIFSQHLRHS